MELIQIEENNRRQRCKVKALNKGVLKQSAFFRAIRHPWSSWFSNNTAIYNKITFKVKSQFLFGVTKPNDQVFLQARVYYYHPFFNHTLCSSVFPSILPSPPYTPHSHCLPSTLAPPCSCQSARVAGQTHIYPQRVAQSGRCLLTVWSSLSHTGDRRQIFLKGVSPRLQVWLSRHRGWSPN